MKLSELIAHAGDDNVRFQNLSECMSGISTNKKGVSKVTFGTCSLTASEVATNNLKHVCLILWIPTNKMPKL